MKFLARLLVSAVSIYIIAYLMAGITVTTVEATLMAAVILGLVNTFIKPLIIFLTLPINIMTLGLFTFLLNGIVLYGTASIVNGFYVVGLVDAIIGSILISIVNMLLSGVLGVKK
ncbi:phage holin family protein [Alkaliphilus peptidifermentans]|uniref:Putative membrane protein n=1 Tax=Alkaliphilus peptidifermentans DSM 18978 TaxID=1120976 RepID=A0A1G5JVL2_9FIRM|nr:phage holin family protein [Alkaliphilus peptidifermentans]SCY92357.1 putative membrane protein [Alkaliphilus peptidifermentans DSM 18978]